jgi:hypothetical protein
MVRFLVFAFPLIILNTAMSAEIFTIDVSYPFEQQIEDSCPWISLSDVQKLTVTQPEEIGWSGGDVGKALGNLLEDTGIETNYSTIASDLPKETKAILFDTKYFNNSGGASILVENITLVNTQGDEISLSLSDETYELKQTKGHSGDSLLVCFNDTESFVRVSTKVSHKNVDGSRPTLGISALAQE